MRFRDYVRAAGNPPVQEVREEAKTIKPEESRFDEEEKT